MIPHPREHFATFTRRRNAAGGSYPGGRWSGVGTSDEDILASVQPVSGRDLLRLPEGLRTRDTLAIITDDDLRTANETSGVEADRLVVNGEEWEVVAVDDWTTVPQLGHRDCLAQRADRAGLP
jgi:hypothetical protein